MKKLLSIILAILMVVTALPMVALPASAVDSYNGVPVRPLKITNSNYDELGLKEKKFVGYYAIRNASELYGFAEMVAENPNVGEENIVLLNDIVINENMSNPVYKWVPFSFSGNLEGNGCTVSGLWVDTGALGYGGLFSSVGYSALTDDRTISGLTIANSKIKSNYAAGALAGALLGQGYTVSNCRVESDVTVETRVGYVGGFFGEISSSYMYNFTRLNRFENCVMAGTVKSTSSGTHTAAIVGNARADGREFYEAANCYYIIDKVQGGSTKYNYAFGGAYTEYMTNKNCTKLSALNGSHTCINVSRVATNPTCVFEGVSAYTHCIYCGKIESGSKTVTKATGTHSMGAYISNNDGTCFENGTQTRKCAYNCGKTETITEPNSASHTNVVTVWSVKASHTDVGYNTHTKCLDCGTKFGYEEYPVLECDMRLSSYIKPTCTESGLIVYECWLECGRRQEETVAPLGHSYEIENGVAPTCKVPGHAAYAKCKQCGHAEESPEIIPAVAHDFSVISDVKEPTCAGEGYTIYKCKWCSEKQKGDFKEKLSHDMDEGTLISALCDSREEYKVKCKNCSYYYIELRGEVIEHSYVLKESKNATCTARGYDEYQCSKCGKRMYERFAETGHNYNGKEEYIIEPGCESVGEKRVYCSNEKCNDYKIVVADALGHDLVAYSEGVEATCTTDGWSAGKKCSRCNYNEGATIIPKKGHIIDNETVLYAPSCKPGLAEGYCSECDEVILREIPSIKSHNLETETVAATCKDKGTKTIFCSECDFVEVEILPIDSENHADILTVKGVDATCTLDGRTDEKVCTACLAILDYAETLEAPGHDYQTVAAVAPTCYEAGSTEYKACARCGYYENGPDCIPALRHNIQVTKEYKQETCTENGNNTEYSCINPGCDFKYGGEIIEKINHDEKVYTLSYRYVGGATCQSYDKLEYFCDLCDYNEIREVPEWGYSDHDIMNSDSFKYVSDEGCKAVCAVCNQPEGDLVSHTPKRNSAGQPLPVSPYYHKGEYGNYTYHIDYECILCGEVYTATVDKSEIGPDYEECNHICHKTGFMGIFAKIALFFWKLFKTNPVCECGAAHY